MASDEILRREFQHGRVAYRFQWNIAHHKELGHEESALSSLWAHLNSIQIGKVPQLPFDDPFYNRASRLSLAEMSPAKMVGFRKKLESTGKLQTSVDDDLVSLLREFHRCRNDLSYSAGHDILNEFLLKDSNTIAIEVPVWSERYKLTGHVDLVRVVDGIIHVCDYKPGPLEQTKRRFINSLPQVAAYGELMTHHLAGTLHSAFEEPLLPKVMCSIFDTHACWHFGAELFVQLQAMGYLQDI